MKNFTIGLIIGIIATTGYFRFLYSSESKTKPEQNLPAQRIDSLSNPTGITAKDPVTTAIKLPVASNDKLNRDSLLSFAKSLTGTPYLYGSTDPSKGFDCSGFITYVFNHFQIAVPRSSYEFENIGKKLSLSSCQKGDLILFTGTNPQERTIGHIGIILDTAGGKPSFIHSSSGKVNGVTITSMESAYYQGRFVSVVDIISK